MIRQSKQDYIKVHFFQNSNGELHIVTKPPRPTQPFILSG